MANPNPSPQGQALEPEWQVQHEVATKKRFRCVNTEVFRCWAECVQLFNVSTGWCLITLHRGRGHGCLRWASWNKQNSQGTPMERASERQTGRFGCRFERRGSPAVQKCTLPWMLNQTNDKRITSITRISWSSENLVSLGEDPTWGWLTLNMHRLYVYLWLGSPSQKQLKFNFLGWDSGTDCSCDRTRCLTRPTRSAFF